MEERLPIDWECLMVSYTTEQSRKAAIMTAEQLLRIVSKQLQNNVMKRLHVVQVGIQGEGGSRGPKPRP